MNNVMYNIKDLRIVMINKDYIEQHEDENLNNFNDNVKFIVEKTIIESADNDKNKYYAEYYTECITEQDLSSRVAYDEFETVPDVFSFESTIPDEYFTEEELAIGKVSALRVFKILQDINVTEKEVKSPVKLKKIG